MSESSGPSPARVRVWDVPTRLVHWSIVLCFIVSWRTGEHGPMDLHRWSGYVLFGLVFFRLYWGIFGSSTARFAGFLRGPSTVMDYVRGRWTAIAGHNPLGALSVFVLLALLVAQVTLGLFSVDVDGIESGPLSLYVSFEAGRLAARWHERVFDLLLWFAGLHVLAVLVYVFVKKQNLLGAMLHGRREYPTQVEPLRPASWVRFAIGVVVSAALTWAVTQAFQF